MMFVLVSKRHVMRVYLRSGQSRSPTALSPEKNSMYSFVKSLGGLQSRSGPSGEENTSNRKPVTQSETNPILFIFFLLLLLLLLL
jgi:hypothetical protein